MKHHWVLIPQSNETSFVADPSLGNRGKPALIDSRLQDAQNSIMDSTLETNDSTNKGMTDVQWSPSQRTPLPAVPPAPVAHDPNPLTLAEPPDGMREENVDDDPPETLNIQGNK